MWVNVVHSGGGGGRGESRECKDFPVSGKNPITNG